MMMVPHRNCNTTDVPLAFSRLGTEIITSDGGTLQNQLHRIVLIPKNLPIIEPPQ